VELIASQPDSRTGKKTESDSTTGFDFITLWDEMRACELCCIPFWRPKRYITVASAPDKPSDGIC